ncbi:MAG: hypothetical protein DRH32_03915, partial [Deltaproteobacteria bacterium]
MQGMALLDAIPAIRKKKTCPSIENSAIYSKKPVPLTGKSDLPSFILYPVFSDKRCLGAAKALSRRILSRFFHSRPSGFCPEHSAFVFRYSGL